MVLVNSSRQQMHQALGLGIKGVWGLLVHANCSQQLLYGKHTTRKQPLFIVEPYSSHAL
jgi:hypothetical protein